MLLQILTYYNVFPCFLDFISNFGHENLTRDSDMLFGGFRGLKSFPEDNEDDGPSKDDINRKAFNQDMKELGRSGLNFQLAFELKTISRSAGFNDTDSGLGREEDSDGSVFDEPRRNAGFIAWIWDRNHPPSTPRGRQGGEDQAETNKAELSLMSWDFTQTAVYHQFDLDSGNSSWIIATAEIDTDDELEDFKQRILDADKLSSASMTEQFKFSLDMVLLLVEWSLSEYGFYITTLDDELNAQTRKYTSEGAPINAKSLMWINRYMESLDHCISGLQANLRVCQAIINFYLEDLLKDPKLRKSGARWTADDPLIQKDIKEFAARLQVSHMALNGMLRRALAVKQTGTRREETIQRLLQNANEQRMKELAHITSRDSTIMKVFTTITIFLLPASVVSSFFSTQIVDFENFPGFTGIWSGPAAVWWAGITFITTVVAVMFAEVAYQVEVKRLGDSRAMDGHTILGLIAEGFSVIGESLHRLWSWLKNILRRKGPSEHSCC
ncbi:hypothetical protein HD806DRAFT_521659 [Xylariaceae sp. AK1471]|nr:hypothetical protein HD806DRAFT_521659 [Xylariaceae sp. AK1471]